MLPMQKYNAILAQKLIDEFGKRNMEGFSCENKEDALQKVLELMPPKSIVSCGGSETLNEIGFRDAMKNGGYKFLDPRAVKGLMEIERVAREAQTADYYLMSANAIAITGEIVNADAIGNRVAALAYGPKHIIIVAGMNKVEPNLESAILRVKTKASQLASIGAQGFDSYDKLEEAAQGAIGHLLITSMSVIGGRIKIVLVGENLGY